MSPHLRPPEIFEADDSQSLWLRDNIPYFECSDPDIQRTYYFRWRVFQQHIRRTPQGHVITEFLPDVPWAGPYNTISCAAGHHFYDGRWLRDAKYLDDYARFWLRLGSGVRNYSFPVADAILSHALVSGDLTVPVGLLDKLIENYDTWTAERRDTNGLFWQIDDRDGMEFQISGSGCRPAINSYMFADAIAISQIAVAAGRSAIAERFAGEAGRLKELVHSLLWDEDARFFKTLPTEESLVAHRQKYGGRAMGPSQTAGRLADVRELQGYLPWAYNLAEPGCADAWHQLADPDGFAGIAGLSTAERRHPAWRAGPGPGTHDCLWRGSSWPFATSQTLRGMANLLAAGGQNSVTTGDYFVHLKAYAAAHVLPTPEGLIPWIDESMDPDTGEWVTRTLLLERGGPLAGRGANYNHSTFADLVVTGLVGLRPRSDETIEVRPGFPPDSLSYFCLDNLRYHGRELTIAWDADGTRYGAGAGLAVYADGHLVESR